MSITKLTGMLLYVAVQAPVPCYDKEKGTEYKASIVVDEDTADAFSDAYPKQAAKKVKRAEFEEKFKVAPPEGDEKNLYVITLKKKSHYTKDGKFVEIPEAYRPRVFEQEGNIRTEITMSKLVGNGSMGAISFSDNVNEHGTTATLKNVLVTDLIEYVRAEGDTGPAGSEFDDAPAAPAKQDKPAKAAPAKAAPAKARVKPADAPADSGGPF